MSLSREEKEWIENKHSYYGTLAEFRNPRDLVAALKRVREEGYSHLDTFSPFGVEEVSDVLELRDGKWIAGLALGFGVLGVALTFAWQTFDSARFYRLNIGGRGFFGWPAYVLPSLDIGILSAVIAMFVGWLWLGRLPHYHHPVFNVPEFSRASIDRFFLLILADDPRYDSEEVDRFLRRLSPLAVYPVPNSDEHLPVRTIA